MTAPTKVTLRPNTGDAGFREMIQKLDGLPAIEELYLRSTNITDIGMQLVSDLRSLKTLSVIKGPITDAGLACLESLCELKSLCLAEVDVTDDGLQHMRRCQKLELLWLNGTKVSTRHAASVAACWQILWRSGDRLSRRLKVFGPIAELRAAASKRSGMPAAENETL